MSAEIIRSGDFFSRTRRINSCSGTAENRETFFSQAPSVRCTKAREPYRKTRSWILARFSNIVIIPKIKSTSNKFCVSFPSSTSPFLFGFFHCRLVRIKCDWVTEAELAISCRLIKLYRLSRLVFVWDLIILEWNLMTETSIPKTSFKLIFFKFHFHLL